MLAFLPILSSNYAMLLLLLADQPEASQIEAIERGLPNTALRDIIRALPLPAHVILNALKIPVRTATLRVNGRKRFTPTESERLFRLVRVRALARDVFSTDKGVAEWLTEPDGSLRGRAPLAMLATDLGTRKVENLLRAMAHGVPV